MRVSEAKWVAAAVLAATLFFLISAAQLSQISASVPFWTAMLGIICAAVALRAESRREADGPAAREWVPIALVISLVALSAFAGLLPSLPLFAAAYWRFQLRARWTHSLLAAAVTLAALLGFRTFTGSL